LVLTSPLSEVMIALGLVWPEKVHQRNIREFHRRLTLLSQLVWRKEIEY
jgi:hypothetical protein